VTDLFSELGPGTFALNGTVGERRLFTYLFVGAEEALLLDTGDSTTPESTILPALAELGVGAEALRYVLVTHPDVDHQGGLARLLEFAPSALPMCGFEDRSMVSDPERMVQQRYRAYVEHGLDYDDEMLSDIRASYGAPVTIQGTLLGGERLTVGGRELRIHHAPGHAAGHLMVEEPALDALFISDAVHGRFSPSTSDTPALPPTYEVVDDYLATIERVREIAPQALYSGHFAPLRGPAIGRFLDESERFVDELDGLLLAVVAEQPATLGELCERATEEFGPFTVPPVVFMFAVHGHLRRLARRGDIRPSAGRHSVPRYALA
jgi:glyoxylase-like metal-dependent hydrolase (beta-lactamase superfamily II)